MSRFACPVVAALLFAVLSGCGGLIDAEEARICRLTLPAVHPEATKIDVTGVFSAPAPYSVRLTYRVTVAGTEHDHQVRCGFTANELSPSHIALDTFATEAGAYSALKVHILNRYWLDRPDYSGLADPGPGNGAQPAFAMPRAAAYFVQAIANALPSTAMTMMIGVAYALIYGLVGRINLAFGELAMVGGYGTVLGAGLVAGLGMGGTGGGIAVAGAAGILLTALWGFAIERCIVAPLVAKSGQSMLVATLALAIVMQEFFRLSQGAEQRWIPPVLALPISIAGGEGFVASVTMMQLVVATLAFGTALFIVATMRWSEFGRQWRAVADDPVMASLLGVSAKAILAETFLLASLAAGMGGVIMSAYYGGAGFAAGTMIGLKALVAAVVGGIGSVGGALVGGLAVGLFEAFWSAYLPIEQRDLAVLLLLVAVLILKPGGLFGFAEAKPRQV